MYLVCCKELYMSLFLHQTTTVTCTMVNTFGCICLFSYIKPQPQEDADILAWCCICLFSYIKPQQSCAYVFIRYVVYVSFPTSNHNAWGHHHGRSRVVYVSFPTSNHNLLPTTHSLRSVVYVSFPTSNHNRYGLNIQPPVVVYVSFPTSNHNLRSLL